HTRFSRDWSSDVCSSDLNTCDACSRQTTLEGNRGAATGNLSSSWRYARERMKPKWRTSYGWTAVHLAGTLRCAQAANRIRERRRDRQSVVEGEGGAHGVA